jgi:phosphohistidine swiveling domain-containing protein
MQHYRRAARDVLYDYSSAVAWSTRIKDYVLIHTQTSETADFVEMMRKITGVVAADVTFGSLTGVIETVTCLAVNQTIESI